MPIWAQRERFDAPRQHGLGAGMRRWTIPAIGALTPIGLIVVNIAAFIVHNLAQFRLGISVLAFVSGVLLNAWTGLNIYRVAKARFPHFGVLHESNQEIVLVIGLLVVIAISAAEGLFCYNGLSNEKNLPNAATFYLGVVAIAIPILLQVIFARLGRGGASDRQRVDGYPSPPPAPDRWENQ